MFQKWVLKSTHFIRSGLEIQMKYPTQEVSTLFGVEQQLTNPDHDKLITESKNNIWFPEDPMDFEKLEPELVYTDNIKSTQSAGTLIEKWNCVRTMTSTMKNSSNIGRNLHYLVRDKVTGKYLGVICITGDFIDLTPRDEHIGWEESSKQIVVNSTIVPLVQRLFPFSHLVSIIQVENYWHFYVYPMIFNANGKKTMAMFWSQ